MTAEANESCMNVDQGGHGLAQIEVMQIIPEGQRLKINFRIPSEAGSSVPYFVEEVIKKIDGSGSSHRGQRNETDFGK